MSNLLEQASLVMIPSGYKEDVVYSEIPINGAGDLSFTRASNGTRVNSAGLVEDCPWNLASYSEQFTQYPPWLIQNLTRADNVTTAPNGTTTAGKIYPSTTSSNPVLYTTPISVVSGENYAASIYAKAAGKNWIFIRTVNDSSAGVWFNLSTGVIGTQTSATGIIESVGNGWYRCTVIGAPTTTNGRCVYLVVDSNGSTTGTASGTDGIYIWGAQLNIGSTAKPYFPTTDRLNVPRLTYQNGGGGCPSLLLEKQSTNVETWSEDFSNASWTKTNCSITANTTTSPDGTQNADKIIENSVNGVHFTFNVGATLSVAQTLSVYAKADTRTQLALQLGASSVIYNLSNGTIVSGSGGAIENAGNGWYRCSITTTPANTNALIFTANGGTNSYQGDGTSGLFIWGAQLEASSYATSYIPTTSSSATRVADACYKTGISSLIGQTEGAFMIDVNLDVRASFSYFALAASLGSAANYIGIGIGGGAIDYEVVVGSVLQAGITLVNSATGRFKIAGAYKANDFVLYINGTQIGTDTSGTVPTCSEIGLFNYNNNQPLKYNQAVIFKTRLTNAELASLTTL